LVVVQLLLQYNGNVRRVRCCHRVNTTEKIVIALAGVCGLWLSI